MLFFIFIFYIFIGMHVLPMYHIHFRCLQMPEEGIGFSSTGIIGSSELLYGCWNLSLLQEQQVLLASQQSVQSLSFCFVFFVETGSHFVVQDDLRFTI